tara:strand:- start:239 stop:604 length:366 start_codon:yes stop_codon:yes gene_type:complete
MFAQKKVITYSLTKKDRKTIRKVWRKWVHIDVSDTSHYIVRDYYNPVVMHNGVNAEALEGFVSFVQGELEERVKGFEYAIYELEQLENRTQEVERCIKLFRERIDDALEDLGDVIDILEIE